jgi:hypothetical protein
LRRIVLLFLTLAALVSCGRASKPAAPLADPLAGAPVNDSPQNAVKRFEWAYKNRQLDALVGLLTADFIFVFAQGDSAGNPYRTTPWGLPDEIISTTHLFAGDVTRAPAHSITLDLGKTLFPLNDARPGKNPRWHKQIRTSVDLKIEIEHGGGATELRTISGNALFYLVRGDSAVISPELVARGFGPDSTRWWIERLEDETLPSGSNGGGLRANPTAHSTWGGVKVLYR